MGLGPTGESVLGVDGCPDPSERDEIVGEAGVGEVKEIKVGGKDTVESNNGVEPAC